MINRRILQVAAFAGIALCSCAHRREPAGVDYIALAEVEKQYGPMVAAGSHPTADQHGTGERIGLFEDASRTLWGLPITVAKDGAILACPPPLVRNGKVTDTFPARLKVISATNAPTGWRAGTGDLELLLRDQNGGVHLQVVRGAPVEAGPACQAPEVPGPPQQLYYYRIAARDGNPE